MISASITIAATPTLILAGATGTRTIYLHVIGNDIVYIGGATVTTATGTATEKHTTPIEITVRNGQAIYGIVASGTADIRILRNS
jgi:hypothetical protein